MAETNQSSLHVWPPEMKDRVELLERLVVTLYARVSALERVVVTLAKPAEEPAPATPDTSF